MLIAAWYALLALISAGTVAFFLIRMQDGASEALWWELTESDRAVSYALGIGGSLLFLMMAVLSFRFTRRPKPLRLLAIIIAICLFANALLGPVLSLLSAVGLLHPTSPAFRYHLEFGALPLIFVVNVLRAILHGLCARELFRLNRIPGAPTGQA
jgi:hypothetical protein